MPVIEVPETLRGAHPVVRATRDAAKGLKSGEDGCLDIGRQEGIAHLQVSRENLARALRILQAVLAEAQRRGWEVIPVAKSYDQAAGVGVAVQGQNYAISIYELRDKVPLTDAEKKKWEEEHNWRIGNQEPPETRPVANGRLAISIPSSYGSGRRSNWREGPRGPLEAKLPAVFDEIETRAVVDAERAKQWAVEREQREREHEAARERQRQAEVDAARGNRVLAEAQAWRESEEARLYLAALRARLPELDPGERGRLAPWVSWAEGWVERNNPVTSTGRIHGLLDPEPRHPGH